MKCPKCKTGILHDKSTRYAQKSVGCTICGAYHDCGSIRMSLDRQITGKEPKNIFIDAQKND